MPLKNSHSHYGAVTKTFHWLTALLILTLIPLGIYANGLPYDTSEALAHKAWMFSLHKSLGVSVFFVALARITWAISQPKPGGLHPDRRGETWVAETVHWLLYGSLLLVPLSGWVHHAATTGFAPIWWPFGQSLPFVPKSEAVADLTAGLHIVFERVLALSIFLHFAGAMKHHFVDRDATLRRMWFGVPKVSGALAAQRVAGPLATALAVWVAAIVIGSSIGVFTRQETSAATTNLEAVQSDWQVQQGTLEILVRQLGSEVSGSFSEWTASIRFDDSVSEGRAGDVDVTIAIGSLSLGSVTSQALGSDFFNATAFPVAHFTADIVATEQGYEAQGVLTIKDQSVPVTFPFTLDFNQGVAQMQGTTLLDRRNFAIGDGQKDEGTLGFGVTVNISLTAARGS
jgi:cytochrome b561/polyisoprenoid-binding protein YceI